MDSNRQFRANRCRAHRSRPSQRASNSNTARSIKPASSGLMKIGWHGKGRRELERTAQCHCGALKVITSGEPVQVFLPVLLPGVTVNSEKIAGWLFLLTLLPLATGLALRARYEEVAARVKPVLDWVSNVSLVPMVSLLAAANTDKILHVFGTRGILAGFLLIALGFGIGWMLGGPGIDTRRALALGTGQRNIAAALVVASESFSDPSVVIMVIVVTIVGLLTLLPLCHVLASYDFKQSTE